MESVNKFTENLYREDEFSNMKKILLLGGSAQQVVAIKTAKQLGYYTVLCDFLPDNPGQYAADKFYLISTTDKEAVLQVARQENVQGVLAYASDPAAPTAAYVAQKMGLPGNPFDSVEILCNKDKFRTYLKDNGFCAPEAKGYTCIENAYHDIESGAFHLPIIVKPVDSSGSKGTTVLHDINGIKALKKAFVFSRKKRIIVEEFIERKHPYLIGGDIFIENGEVILWGLLNCHRDPKGNQLVPVGKSYPLLLDKEDVQRIRGTLKKLVEKLGIQNGAMNVELIIDRDNHVFPIDIGPRSGGNMIPDLLGDIFQIDIPRMCVQAAMGEKINFAPLVSEGCYTTVNLHSRENGIYKGIWFSEKIQQHIYRVCLYKKEGDAVEKFENASSCLGVVFLKFNDEDTLLDMWNHIDDHIKVELQLG